MRFCTSRLLSSCVSEFDGWDVQINLQSSLSKTRGIRTYCSPHHTTDGEILPASQDPFRHDAVVRCIFGACDKAACLLCNNNTRLRRPSKLQRHNCCEDRYARRHPMALRVVPNRIILSAKKSRTNYKGDTPGRDPPTVRDNASGMRVMGQFTK